MGEVHKAELSTVTEERDALKATAQEATERAIVLDKEVATLQLKLDDAKRGWSQCEDKLNEQIAALQAAHEELRAKDDQLQATADAADRLQQEVASVHESLQEKEALLHSIHAVSKQAAGLADGHLPAKRTRTAQTIPQQLHVRFDDTVHVTEAGSGSEDEWGEEEDVHGAGDPYEDEEQEVAEEDALAVVVHRPAPKQRGPAPRAFGRPVRGAKPVGGSVTAPMVEEPSDSDDDDDEHAEMSRQVVQQGRGRRGGGAEVPAAGGRGMRMASMMGQKRTGIARMPRGGAKGASVPQRAMGRAHPQPKAKGSRMAGPPVVAKATKVKGLPAPGLFSLFNHLNHASPGST